MGSIASIITGQSHHSEQLISGIPAASNADCTPGANLGSDGPTVRDAGASIASLAISFLSLPVIRDEILANINAWT